MKRLRVGVIGAGARSAAHLPLIRLMQDKYELAAICDALPARARQAGEQYAVPWYEDVVTMLDREQIDVADIVLPPDAHHVVAVIASQRGVHLMIETPISITRPCIDAILDAARVNGVKLEVAEQVWRWPEERLKRRVIESGLIGDLLRVYCVCRTGGYHAVNAMRAYTGRTAATRVWGLARSFPVPTFLNFGEPTTTEDWDHAVVEFEGGVLGIHEQVGNWLSPFRRDLPRRLGVDAGRGFICEDEIVVFDGEANRRHPIVTETVDVGGVQVPRLFKVETEPPVIWENPYAGYPVDSRDGIGRLDYWHSLYRAIVEDTEPDYGGVQARIDQELPIAYRQSALDDGRPVDLPLEGLTAYEEHLHRQYAEKYGRHPLKDLEQLASRVFPHFGVRWQV